MQSSHNVISLKKCHPVLASSFVFHNIAIKFHMETGAPFAVKYDVLKGVDNARVYLFNIEDPD